MVKQGIACCFCSVIPEFLKPNDAPHDINVTEGNDVVINCRTNAIPAASVVWYINGNVYNGMTLMTYNLFLCYWQDRT